MSRKAINKIVTRTALSAVFIMGFISAFSILDRPNEEPFEYAAAASSTRAPASLGGLAEQGAAVLDLECTSKSFHVIGAQQIRLRGNLCKKAKGAKVIGSRILNSSNGMNATVFFTEESRFTTDYIQVERGLNHIRLEYEFNNGSKEISQLDVQSE